MIVVAETRSAFCFECFEKVFFFISYEGGTVFLKTEQKKFKKIQLSLFSS